MRRFTAYRLCSLLLLGALLFPAPDALAAWPFRKKAAPAEEKKETPKPTPYQKFLKKKGLKSVTGTMKLYTDGKDVWLEVPDSLTGRKVLLSTVLRDSSDPWVEVGQRVNTDRILLIGRTDSLLVLSEPVRLPESDDPVERATLRAGVAPAVRYAFPIMTRSADSAAVLVKATKLFDPSNKDVIQMRGFLYGDSRGLMDGTLKSELSLPSVPVTYGKAHVGLSRELTFEGIWGNYNRSSITANHKSEKARITGDFVTLLSLVPDREIPVRKADARVGVRRQAFRSFSSDKGVKTEYDAVRWNLAPGDRLTVYIDTLFSASRQEAIRRGVEAWNEGFRAAGLGDVVRAVPYPADSSFCADDPFLCKVVSTHCDIDLLQSSTTGNALTGGVLGATITVPQGYLTQLWREYAFTISEADDRFRTLFPSEDALCDILCAAVMRQFGTVLGLSTNLAGSAAYSPAQLRDPAFTATHGITASVMDQGAMFNTLARPGDRERGVPTISNRIGAYDKFAVNWLYRVFPEGTDAVAALREMVDAREGDPEYLYLPEQGNGLLVRDYRARRGDLGNDPVEEYNRIVSTLKYVASHAKPWVSDPRLSETPDSYLFYEWLWLSFSDATQLLTTRLGGLRTNVVGTGPKFTPVPKAVQKEYLKTIFAGWRDLGWIEADREFLHLSGPYRTAQDMNYRNMGALSGVTYRLPSVILAWKEAGCDYSPSEYMDDVEAQLFRQARSGRLAPQEDMSLGIYMMYLINSSPVLKAAYTRAADPLGGRELARLEEVFTPVEGIPVVYVEELDLLCKQHLEKIRSWLRQGSAHATDPDAKAQIAFLLHVADTALE